MAVAIGALLLAAFALLSFGWALLRGPAERALSKSVGRRVEIGHIRRVGWPSLTPTLELADVRVAQPAWAGGGDMLRLRRGRIRLPLLPLLAGRVRAQAIAAEGLRAALVRDATGRANWEPDRKQSPSGSGSPDLGRMTLSDAVVTLADAKRQRDLTIRVAMDARGVRARGSGTIAGGPATLRVDGAPVARRGAWPFRLAVASPSASLEAVGTMRRPLDLGHFTARIASRGRDLHDLDRIVEAGLPGTQDYRLTATVTHDESAWTVERIAGTIGRSALTGMVKVHKDGERTLLDGRLDADRLDFDDLATDEGLARGRALERAIGPRLAPATRIDLSHLRRLDGTLRVSARRLLFRQPSELRSFAATLTLDHGVLTVAPLVVQVGRGRLLGSAVVRHPDGVPRLHLDLRLVGARVEEVLTDASKATGPLAGRIRLDGRGLTVRDAIGRADGTIGLVASGGTTDRRIAFAAGADVGRALLAGAGDRVELRCLIARLRVDGGLGRPAPLILDSAVSRADGTGAVRFADERLALVMRGMPKRSGGLRIAEPIRIEGTLKQPKLELPAEAKTAKGIFGIIKRAIGGGQPVAQNADCAALAARTLG